MATQKKILGLARSPMRWARFLVFLVGVLCIAETTFPQAPFDAVHGDTLIVRRKKIPLDSAGHYVHVRSVSISGNKLTRPSIILRELRVKEAAVVRKEDLNYILEKEQQKIFNLHLFNTVTVTAIPVEEGVVDINVEVRERWFTFPVPRFQLSDRNFNEWWQNYNHDLNRVNYGLKLYQYNLWGRNHTLLMKAQFGFQKHFQVSYRIPYINKKQKQGLIIEFDYIDGKSVPDSTEDHKLHFIKSRSVLRTTRGIGLTYTYRKNFYEQHRVKYEYRFSNIDDTLAMLNPNYFGEGLTHQGFDALTYEINSDHSDVSAYPLRGYAALLGFKQQGILRNKDVQKTSAYFKFAAYIDLTRNFYLSNLSYAYLSSPDRMPYYSYSTMGYDKIFVRGYEVYVIEGPQYFLNKTTLKKKLLGRTWHLNNWKVKQFNYLPFALYVKAYADWGYVNNYSAYREAMINNALSDKVLRGTGFGLDMLTGYDLVIRFEYTFTPNGNGFFLNFAKEF